MNSTIIGFRPAIILSPQSFNRIMRLAIVCPVTRQVKGYPFEVELPDGLEIEGAILTDHVKSIDWKSRNMKVISQAPDEVTDICIKRIHTFIYL